MSEYIMEFPAFDSDGWESDKDKWHTQAELKEQIVRCRDCEWWQPQNDTHPPTCVGLGGMWGQSYNEDGNGFCAWGKRRDDA